MTDNVLILPDSGGGEALFARRLRSGGIETRSGDLAALKAVLAAPYALVLPGQRVRAFLTDVPEKIKSSERLSVARFAHEDRLANMPDALHIILGDADPAPTLMVDRTVMDAVLSRFDPAVILADFEALTPLAGQDIALLDRVVTPGLQGFTVDADWADGPVKTLSDEMIARAIFERIDSGEALNLRQGLYRRRAQFKAGPWARVAAAAILCGFIGFGLSWADVRAKMAQTEALQDRAQRIYTQQTGQAPPSNFAALARQQGPATDNPTAFLDLSNILFAALSAHPDIVVERLSFEARENSLRLRLIYPGFDAASALEQTAANAGAIFTTGGVREQNGQFIGDAALSLGDPS